MATRLARTLVPIATTADPSTVIPPAMGSGAHQASPRIVDPALAPAVM